MIQADASRLRPHLLFALDLLGCAELRELDARGGRTGARMTRMPSEPKSSSKAWQPTT
jgi:hypothetical protein